MAVFFLRRSGSDEELLSRFGLARLVFRRRESIEVELDVELDSSLLEVDSLELLDVPDDEELLPFLTFLSFFLLNFDSIFI